MATPTEHDREALVKRLGRWADLPVPELAKDVREAIAALTAQGGGQTAMKGTDVSENTQTSFVKQLEQIINGCSLENGSDTPDFILAKYLKMCLENFDSTVVARERWYGREAKPVLIEQTADTVSVPREPETWFSPYPIWTNMRSSVGVVKKSDYDKLRAHAVAVTAERDAMRESQHEISVALGVPGCNAAEMLNIIDGLREDAERYRWLKENTILREQKENMRFVWEFPNWLTRSGDYPYTRNDSIDAAIDAAMRNANET